MTDQYFSINIRNYLDKNASTYIGEENLCKLFSDFSCPNPDVEYFLLHNAVEFTKKDQSVTYLVFNAADAALAGYYSIAVKPISIRADSLSKSMCRKLARVSTLDEQNGIYSTTGYLIAQIGKNYSIPSEQRINGDILLGFALNTISAAKYSVGGMIEFLECENNDALMKFYMSNNFRLFDVRVTMPSHGGKSQKLNQLLRLI